MLIHTERIVFTTVLGEASGNTNMYLKGICHEILVKPASSNTQYDISIVNYNNLTIYERTSEIGDLGEVTELPMSGVNTVSIGNATKDEEFIVELIMRES